MKPGLVVLHSNRLESLRDAVIAWLARRPLAPLEDEVFLVQSNGAAEWLKMSMARANGICASARVELPARFLWRTYRQVLGRSAVPVQSALDKAALTWRLMRLLPARKDAEAFAPIASFLHGDEPSRRLQLAERLADLFDQYQVYRADWLDAWVAGRDQLIDALGRERPLSADERWQAALWRELIGELSDDERRATRPQVHRDFLAALDEGSDFNGSGFEDALPRRVTVFGVSQLPGQTLHALAALARHTQVLLAIPNPCRFHWADIIEGRDLHHSPRRRHASRGTQDLAAVSLEAMHAHAHPLLAAWGRQGRDFMRQLDQFDDSQRAQQQFDIPRIDLFDDGPGRTLLEQVQASIRDLLPLQEHPARAVARADRSIVFQVGHSPQREVEILHDQLLQLFATPPGGEALRPRDVVVMVPDIETFAPSIRAVFGQYPREDARCIPFDIADLRGRGFNPLLIAVEWLLRLPTQRIGLTEVRALLDVPAIASRFGLATGDLPTVSRWLANAGVRWGLNEAQRADLGLQACGDQNSWAFGLRRMLLGYASGGGAEFDGIEPFEEIGGLDAALVGSLVDLVDALTAWWQQSAIDAAPPVWAARGRSLLETFVAPTDEQERLTVAALGAALTDWVEACVLAGFDEPIPLAVLREAWLDGVDTSGRGGRFLAGGVTFCTLMPLRAVPFEVVCLLGMNDGAYPRATRRNDFDLMGLPGQQRPGDRSRRDDDRYLMLEALLSARRVLSISWSGRSVRDNTVQPPSVLVSQLRDYLAAAWDGEGMPLLDQLTTEHPLQPFSRRYFVGGPLFTYAAEWRAAHAGAGGAAAPAALPAFEPAGTGLTLQSLTRFLRNPVKEFLRARLDVSFRDDKEPTDDDESFGPDGLQRYALLSKLADPVASTSDGRVEETPTRLALALALATARMRRTGELPIGELGGRLSQVLRQEANAILTAWHGLQRRYPQDAPRQPLRFEHEDLTLDDWLDGLRSDGQDRVVISWSASRLADKSRSARPRPAKLVETWVRTLVASALDVPVTSHLVGNDVVVTAAPLDPELARAALVDLLRAWREGMASPLPLPIETGYALVAEAKDIVSVYEGAESNRERGEVREPSLARVFPDYEALTADGRFEELAWRLLGPMHRWMRLSVSAVRHPDVPISQADDDD